jgi:SAM-dependent methyltransferase
MSDPEPLVVDPGNVEQAQAWDGAEGDYWAEHADRFDRSLAGYQPAFLDAARIERGDRVLDIGCGTGQDTRAAARRAGDGCALGVDLSARMIEVARRRAVREGLPNARFARADAQIHPFPPAGFDLAISRTGAMFFGDPVAAFGNIARALRPGGRLTLLTWQPAARNEWFGACWTALTGRDELPTPPPGAPGPFSMSDPARMRTLLSGTGFTDIQIIGRTAPVHFGRDAADAQQFLLGLLSWMLRDRDDPDRGRAALLAALHDHQTPHGVCFGSAAWLVTAHRT